MPTVVQVVSHRPLQRLPLGRSREPRRVSGSTETRKERSGFSTDTHYCSLDGPGLEPRDSGETFRPVSGDTGPGRPRVGSRRVPEDRTDTGALWSRRTSTSSYSDPLPCPSDPGRRLTAGVLTRPGLQTPPHRTLLFRPSLLQVPHESPDHALRRVPRHPEYNVTHVAHWSKIVDPKWCSTVQSRGTEERRFPTGAHRPECRAE